MDARVAAEQAWLTALQDHASPLPLDLYGGYLAQWWTESRGRLSDLIERCPIGIPERTEIVSPSSDPCVIANWASTTTEDGCHRLTP